MGKENRTGAYELGSEADLAGVLDQRARSTALAIRTASVGTVVSYDPVRQEATITVDHLQVVKVMQSPVPGTDPNLTNTVAPQAPITLIEVPVIFGGSGDASSYTTYPILPGSTGLLIVVDRSLDTWVNRTAPIPVDPVKSTIHSLADAVFFPGFTDRLHRITPSAGTSLGTVIEAPQIYVGKEATATTSAAIAERVVDGVTAVLNSAINTLNGQPAPVTGLQVAAALTTALGVWQALASTLASTKVKVAP